MAEIVRHGTWLYDGVVPADVNIVKLTDADIPPGPEDEGSVPGYPPRDGQGYFYGVDYFVHGRAGTSKGVSARLFGSVKDASRHATDTLKVAINWDDTPRNGEGGAS